ncbi:UDP-glucose 4-epimerase GalE [Escherichia albertii]|uniref:UDP-glucose 4-epimerase n=1 Tax=Escherichia albertii TaxID=208962 RepID=A0A5A4U403_ESCAL|nr:UDP-glucose 4-epimerase GalE [Escherichia albertii]MCZ8630997.1 UDP-glucose 4-epimerase GalE [Escherichia albertii]MCZ8635837.1 UDP-glucose 4-epimerase GalE [Escherichia albertii]MCZ8672883.1 UDP-glucose 4-epimerase GalE [Escherichia albertii]BBM62617.1 UDP-glucose 4-epimerase [Escherichia albertii]
MAILVTGGTGYIGSHTVAELLKVGYEIIVIDNLVNSSYDVVDKIKLLTNRDFLFYEGDINDKNLLLKIFSENNITDVIHFAGLKSVGESAFKPLEYYNTNVIGTLTLVNAMLLADVHHIIFSSSATVYGEPEKIPLTENCSVGGTTNPYGTSKFMAELMLQDIANANKKLNVTLLRYFNPVGAHPSGLIGEQPQGIPNNLVPLLTMVADGKMDILSVFGNDYPTRDGSGVRDYIHVMDLAEGHIAALKNTAAHSNIHVYNLGTGKGYSVLELIKIFEEVTGVTVKYKITNRRPGDIAECWADPSLAEEELKWKAHRTIEQMLMDAWNWQLKTR